MRFVSQTYRPYLDGSAVLWYLGTSIVFCFAWLLYKIYATLM